MNFLIILLLATSATAAMLETHPRIFGGDPALIEEFPYLVAFINREAGYVFCAGTLIAEKWVVTAAHCEVDIRQFYIEYAATDLFISGPEAHLLTPTMFIPHESFSTTDLTYDVALVKTKETPYWHGFADFYAKLAVPGLPYHLMTDGIVAGWGTWSFYNTTRPPLQKAHLKLYDSNTCKKHYRGNTLGLNIFPHQLCAGTHDFSRSECSGDSGGPLFVHKILVGIVSWSIKPCTVAKYPGVFTDVSYFLPWIREKTGLEFDLISALYRKPPPA